MLQGVVGSGKAIVRVNADINFDKVTLSEEEYDPSSAAIRSKKDIEESSRTETTKGQEDQTVINERRGILPSPGAAESNRSKKETTTNYEMNKVARAVLKPAGTVKRLSVAAAIDGSYKVEKQKDGTTKRMYVPRNEEEIKKFEALVKRAMGFNEDREDQVSVISMPFFDDFPDEARVEAKSAWEEVLRVVGDYKRGILNLVLVIMVFLIIVRPLVRSMKGVAQGVSRGTRELPAGKGPYTPLGEPTGMTPRDRVLAISRENPDKTARVIKGWIGE
jgi:flagellar M-ring protein FliF